MATSAPNTTPDPRPTGDLEHLFRQKFAEAEVTPRASLWEQLDHELLVQQNDTYRRRLSVHRWVAAACLLFFLGLGSWALLHQRQTPAGAGLATRRAASGSSATTDSQPALASTTAAPDTDGTNAGSETTESASLLSSATRINPTEQQLVAQNENVAAAPANIFDPTLTVSDNAGVDAYKPARAIQASSAGSRYAAVTDPGFAGTQYATGGTGLLSAQFGSNYPVAESSSAVADWNSMAPRFAGLRGGWLGSRPDTLKASLRSVPQPAIGALAATQDQTPTPPTKLWRRLRLGGSYAGASYNPNVDFSKINGQVAYAYADQANLVSNALRSYYQEDAETEYRRNLRAGLSQRVAFTAAYTLNKRLTLTSGVEAGQQTATSATSYGFLDGQQVNQGVAALFSNSAYNNGLAVAAPAALRKTSYRYRTVAVPMQVRYGSQRSGTSLYAKVGAAVGLLLSTKSELQDYSLGNTRVNTSTASSETTRRYSLSSTDSPYRKVQASVRGGAGVRYQPANATWSAVVGPTAELGLTTLNSSPGQGVLSQRRPYSVGLEASVEFNSHKPTPTAP
ncbi:hypothetical protein [Hymenobacter sp.]|jgi:hypothetical protein|uniref:hypothetical protein n=1 Tax=Hymenobacter sp. TaxID=1898978 RepID=UPI002ED7BCFD